MSVEQQNEYVQQISQSAGCDNPITDSQYVWEPALDAESWDGGPACAPPFQEPQSNQTFIENVLE